MKKFIIAFILLIFMPLSVNASSFFQKEVVIELTRDNIQSNYNSKNNTIILNTNNGAEQVGYDLVELLAVAKWQNITIEKQADWLPYLHGFIGMKQLKTWFGFYVYTYSWLSIYYPCIATWFNSIL